MNRRLVIAGIGTAAVIGTVVPSFASSPVTVNESTDNGVFVGVGLEGEPVAGAWVTPEGTACAGVSKQIPQCVDAGPVLRAISVHQSLPVTVRHDDQETAVGVGKVGVIVSNDGTICPVVSTQDWRCVSVGSLVR